MPVQMEISIDSGGIRLAAHVSRPSTPKLEPLALVLCHGFPAGPNRAAGSGRTYPDLAARLAEDTDWTVLAFNFRGTGQSQGDFSLAGWIDDLQATVNYLLEEERAAGVWVAGSGTGGAVAICEAAEDERVRGVATLAAPADFESWVSNPAELLDQVRHVGVVRSPSFPADLDAWAGELHDIRPLAAAGKIPPRPFLIIHGSDDPVVPVQDARAIADAAHAQVELRILGEGGHRLRHDPRAIAVLMGWMERQTLG